jgi:sulfite reductase (ferredoxin)
MGICYKIPPNLGRDIDELESLIAKYKRGEITAVELKAHRVPFGVYEQRERDTYMVRIRCAAGIITPSQLEEVTLLASQYGRGVVHLTTRQELQIHYVKLDDIVPIIRKLKEAGLASRGGGGNTVRNITAQEDAGIDNTEVFDVTPYAIALTNRLIAEEDSWTLPRKLKIAFSGSGQDKGYATIADVGFIAVVKGGKKGFKVYAAGGMGARYQVGKLLFDFIPADEAYYAAKAVKALFWKYGNRKNKHAARLRFLWQSLGEEEFKKRIYGEYEALKKDKVPLLEIEEIDNTSVAPDLAEKKVDTLSDLELWKKRFVRPQKQDNLFAVIIPVELGFIDSSRLEKLAGFLKAFGDNVIRMTKDQNLLARNIPGSYLGNVYVHLKSTLEHFNRPYIFDRVLSCAGASTCQLGICLSRAAARAIMKEMSQDKGLDLDRLNDIKINISGCSNSCGQHLAADIGFFGKASRKNTRLYPAYNVVAGAVIKDGGAEFAETVGEVSARDLPKLVRDYLRQYYSSEGRSDLEGLCRKYKDIPDFEEDKNYYFDWESDKAFSIADRGSGECSAGLFDLIELDLKNIQEAKDLRDLVFYAARMLLITRGIEPKTDEEAFASFREYFVKTNLVDTSFEAVLSAAQNRDAAFLRDNERQARALAERVKFLYDHMDNSFHFTIQADLLVGEKKPAAVKDLRGVACPMNFVKTKMELSNLRSKEMLEVWLDDGEPIENVPGSVREEGHIILSQKKIGNYWSVVIQKK